mgnify:FL=1
MVSAEELNSRFTYHEGRLIWKNGRREGLEAGYHSDNGYCYINFKLGGNSLRMMRHRIIFYMFNSYLPDLVDHIDQNTRNDEIENLREADKSLNALNTPPRSNNKTGYKGVHKYKGKYRASVYNKGKKVHLGSFCEVEGAVREIEDWRHFNEP